MSANQGLIEAEDIRASGIAGTAYTDATSTRLGPLAAGRYILYATTDVWITRGDGAVTGLTGASAGFLPAEVPWPLVVDAQDLAGEGHTQRDYLAMVRVTTSGTLYVTRVDRG